MSNWQDRLQESIQLTSPKTGTVFTAYWTGSDLSAEKRLGKFSYPLSVGTVVQDLGLSGFDMSFTIYFEGPDNDIQSWAFLRALEETGTWEIIHPVRGKLKAQPVSVKAHDSPVDSGNVTAIDMTWIIPDALRMQHSAPELGGVIVSTNQTLTADAAADFSAIGSALAPLAAAYGSVQAGIASVKGSIVNATAAFLTTYGQLSGALSSLSTDVLSIVGMTVGLIQTPGLVIGSTVAQIKGFVASGESILGLAPQVSPGALTPDVAAQAQGVELVAVALSGAMALSILAQAPTTRPQAIASINLLLGWWSDMLGACEGTQALYASSALAQAYTAFASSYPDLMELLRLSIEYLLSIIYDLTTEIRFILPAERSTVAVAIDCYRSKGWDDSYIDLFIASNGLYGDLVNLLPAGFEVVYYA